MPSHHTEIKIDNNHVWLHKLLIIDKLLCHYTPVLCGVRYSSNELYSFGVVVDLSV